MMAVMAAAFLTPSPMRPENSLGNFEVYRIFYFHVPQAWVASLAFLVSMIYSIRYLASKNMDYDMKAATSAKLGLFFSILATLTGSIFAKMTWGEFWNWSEIREVSIFILLIIYGAYFTLRSAVADQQARANLAAVMAILFAAAALFLIFILPRIYSFSQHPSDSIIDKTGSITMSTHVSLIFFTSLAVFTGLFYWLFNLSVRIERINSINNMEPE